MRRGGLEVPRVLSHAGAGRVAARAHARVISEPSFVEIRMRQSIHHGDPLVLREVRERGQRTIDSRPLENDCPSVSRAISLFMSLVNDVTLWREGGGVRGEAR